MNTLFPVIGQQRILEMLHTVDHTGRYANAYMFQGPEGTGKEAMAMEFAAILNCQSVGEKPCGTCPGCKQMRHLQHPNVQLLFALPGGSSGDKSDPLRGLSESVIESIQKAIEAKSRTPYTKIRIEKAQNIRISSVRAMQKSIHLGRPEAGRKVVLILEAERMNTEAFNSILKVVEEPPADTSFIFCTSAEHLLPPTIRSRCQSVPFRVLTSGEIAEGLREHTQLKDEAAIEKISRLADGDFGFALTLAEQDLNEQEEALLEFIRAVMKGDGLPIKQQVDRLESIYRESPLEFRRFVALLQIWFRDARVWSETENVRQLVFPEMLEKIQRFVEFYQAADYATVQALLENAIDFIERNVYIRLALHSMQIQLHLAIRGNLEGIPYGSHHRYHTDRFC